MQEVTRHSDQISKLWMEATPYIIRCDQESELTSTSVNHSTETKWRSEHSMRCAKTLVSCRVIYTWKFKNYNHSILACTREEIKGTFLYVMSICKLITIQKPPKSFSASYILAFTTPWFKTGIFTDFHDCYDSITWQNFQFIKKDKNIEKYSVLTTHSWQNTENKPTEEHQFIVDRLLLNVLYLVNKSYQKFHQNYIASTTILVIQSQHTN